MTSMNPYSSGKISVYKSISRSEKNSMEFRISESTVCTEVYTDFLNICSIFKKSIALHISKNWKCIDPISF